MTGLLDTGARKEAPLWYDVYRKYPPKIEPISERPLPPQDPIPEIIYEEDFDRAKRQSRESEAKKSRKKPGSTGPNHNLN